MLTKTFLIHFLVVFDEPPRTPVMNKIMSHITQPKKITKKQKNETVLNFTEVFKIIGPNVLQREKHARYE